MDVFQQGLSFGSYFVFPFLLWCIYRYTVKRSRIVLFLFVLSLLFVDMRFIEPNIVITREESFSFSAHGENEGTEVRMALLSDIHLGVYRGKRFFAKTIDTVIASNPDIVLIPGDFIYYISSEELVILFEEFSRIDVPIYAVTGNHDAGYPGPYTSSEIRRAISASGVIFLDNDITSIDVKGKKLRLVGLSDLWEGDTNYSVLKNIRPEDNAIVIAHNPDTVYDFPSYDADLVVSGHTHGGQIRIPFLYKRAIPSSYGFDKGWYDVESLKVYVTSGLGIIGLPLRFLNLPEVVLISSQVY